MLALVYLSLYFSYSFFDFQIVFIVPSISFSRYPSNKPELFDTFNNKTIADTLAAPFAGKLTFEYVKEYVDDIINVSEEEMIESLRMMLERLKIVPEPAASACFVPILFNKIKINPKSKCLVVVCGGNIDIKKIKSLF